MPGHWIWVMFGFGSIIIAFSYKKQYNSVRKFFKN